MIDEYDPQSKIQDQMSLQLLQNNEIKESIKSKDALSPKTQDIIFGIDNLEQFYFQKSEKSQRLKDSKQPSKTIDSSQNEVIKINSSIQSLDQQLPISTHIRNGNQPDLKYKKQHEKGKQISQDLNNLQFDQKNYDKIQTINQSQDDETDNIYKLNIVDQQKLIAKNELDCQQMSSNHIKQNNLQNQRYFVNCKAIAIEKIFSDKFLIQKKEFENKIAQEKSLSNEKEENYLPKILNQKEQLKQTKPQKNIQNVLKRELGLELPSPTKKKGKRLQQKKNIKENYYDEGEEEEENDFFTRKNNQETESETKIHEKRLKRDKNNKRNINENDSDNYQSEDNFENTGENNSEESEQEQQNKLRRSSRVKRAPVSLDNNIFTIYEQKKSSLKEKDMTSNESKQSSSDTKQIEEKNLFSSSLKKQKQKNSKLTTQNQNKLKKQKLNDFFNDEQDQNDYQSNNEDSGLSDYFYPKSKPSKKLKQDDNKNQGQLERCLQFDDSESSAQEENKTKKNDKQKQKKRNNRNLEYRDDESQQEQKSFNGNDSFQIMLDSSATEQEELLDLGYIIDKLNQYENQENQDAKQDQDNEDLDDDMPIDLPDLTSHFFYDEKEEQNQDKTIFQLESNISILEQKIFFLKEDSKLKKYSILNDQNFELYQQKELKRLMGRKEMLEQQIQQKKKIKIEKYRQQLHYFDQILDLKFLPNIKKSLTNNIDKQVPSYRLIKFKSSQSQDFSKELPLIFQFCDPNSKFQIIGFSDLRKVNNQKQAEHANLIHNFFSFEK